MKFLEEFLQKSERSYAPTFAPLLGILKRLTPIIDDVTSELTRQNPDFLIPDEAEEPEVPDEMSVSSTCATPVVPSVPFASSRLLLPFDRNYARDFFEKELESFAAFLSEHEHIVLSRIQISMIPDELHEAKVQLEEFQVS